jgi:hypothetical protein
MASPVVPDIDNQSFPVYLGKVRSVEFGISGRTHVGNMDISDPTFCPFMDGFSVLIHPLAITGGCFIPESFDIDGLFVRENQRDFCSRLIYEEFPRGSGSAIYRSEDSSYSCTDPGTGERRTGVLFPSIPLNNACDFPSFFVGGEIDPEKSL